MQYIHRVLACAPPFSKSKLSIPGYDNYRNASSKKAQNQNTCYVGTGRKSYNTSDLDRCAVTLIARKCHALLGRSHLFLH